MKKHLLLTVLGFILFTLPFGLTGQSQIVLSGCNGLNGEVFTQAEDVGNCPCYESPSGIIYWANISSGMNVYNTSLFDCAGVANTTPGIQITGGPFCDIFLNGPIGLCSIQPFVAQAVPTMSQWAMIILGLALSISGVLAFNKRKLLA